MRYEDVYYRRFLIILFLTTAFRLFYINLTELTPDESYYWDLSRRLQLSYFDHPPMLMYMISLFTKVFGSTEFAVRLPSVIISSIITAVVFLLGKELFDERVGLYSAFLANITLIYAVGGVLSTIDTPFALFWVSGLYFGVKALKTGDGKWWYLKDVALGFGMLSKYVMVLFVPAFLIFIFLSRDHRHWLKRKEPYVGSIIAIIIFSPVILWNAQNDWISFKFQLAHGLKVKKKTGLPSLMEYLGSQAAVLSPLLFAALILATVRGAVVWFKEKDWRYLYLATTSAFVFLFFAYSSLRAKVEGNWAMSAYFAAIISLASLYSQSSYRRKKAVAAVVAGTALVFTIFAHIQGVTPVIFIKKDPTDQLHGWNQLGKEVGDALRGLKAEEGKKTFILADSHQLTAELAFYTPFQPRVYELAGRGRVNQYSLWESPDIGSDALFVADPGLGEDPYIRSLFEDVKEVKKAEIKRGEKVVKTYSLFICRNFRGFKG